MEYTPIICALFGPFFVVSAAVALVAWLRPRFVGAIGRAAVSRRLRQYCAELANELILPDGRVGLTQLDHLALTAAGLPVVETKNSGGLKLRPGGRPHLDPMHRPPAPQAARPAAAALSPHQGGTGTGAGVPVSGLVVFTNRARFRRDPLRES